MLPVSTVYVCWKHGDMVDAYLPLHGIQVLIIKKLCAFYRLTTLCSDGVIRQTTVSGYQMLEIREDVEGVAA